MSSIHPKLKALFPVADAIVATMGTYSEVVLHDISRPEASVIYVAGTVTGRQIGAPLTDLVLEKYRQQGNDCDDILSYSTTTREGKALRSSTTFVRDEQGSIIGCLCMNVDLSPILSWKYFLENTINIKTVDPIRENFTNDVSDVLNSIIKSIMDSYTVPVANLPKEEKLAIIEQLDGKGAFMVKGTVEIVAAEFGVSRYSIYNYLEEVRTRKSSD